MALSFTKTHSRHIQSFKGGGFSRCDGIYFIQFQEKYHASAQYAAWPISLMTALYLFMGPVCGAVSTRYSMRTAFIIGTLLVFIGFLMTAFSPDVFFLFFSYTLFGGLGRGLLVDLLLLNLYFDKHRSLVTGLGSSGVGFGAFWVVPLVQFLFDTYGMTGSFMIQAALALHGLFVAMLFRPLSLHQKFKQAKRKRMTKETKTPLADAELQALTPSTNTTKRRHKGSQKMTHRLRVWEIYAQARQLGKKMRPESETPDAPASTRGQSQQRGHCCFFTPNGGNLSVNFCDNVAQMLSKQLQDIHDWFKSSLKICFPVEKITRMKSRAAEEVTEEEDTEEGIKAKKSSKKAKVFHWELLRNSSFLVFCFSNLFFQLAFRTAFTFLPAMTISKGLTNTEAALVLTISGAADTFGRVIFGFIMNARPFRHLRVYVFNCFLFLIAGISLLIPALTSFWAFSVIAAVYGLLTGAFICQKNVVLVDTVGRDVVASSVGILRVFQGIGTVVGPPFAGALRDALGSYDSSFYLGGACMAGAGCLMVFSMVLHRIKARISRDSIQEVTVTDPKDKGAL